MNRVKLPVSRKREKPFVMSRPGTMFGISDDSMTMRSVRTPPFTKMYTKMCHAATASANTTAVSTAVNTMCAAMVALRSIFRSHRSMYTPPSGPMTTEGSAPIPTDIVVSRADCVT